MGTGLGGALLLYSRNSKIHEVLPCEFGHTIMPPLGSTHPDAARERRMVEFISKKLYNNASALEVEDICSGRGIGYAYEWVISELSDPSLVPANLSIAESK
jgi:glucokinase